MFRFRSAALVLLFALSFAPTARAQIYVDQDATGAADGSSWTDAYPDLQDAINAADGSSELWIAGGVYTPDSEGDSFTITGSKDGIELYGGFKGTETARSQREPTEHRTILSGDVNGDDADPDEDGVIADVGDLQGGENAHHVVLLDGGTALREDVSDPITSETVLDGITITAGQADGSIPENAGGGLYCDGEGSAEITGGCSPTLTALSFVGNQAQLGGAILVRASNGRSDLTVDASRFRSNAADNSGGGVYSSVGSSPGSANLQIRGTTFEENTAANGGAIYHSASSSGTSTLALRNVWFDSNTADAGGAIYNSGFLSGRADMDITNTVFTANQAERDGGALRNGASNLGVARVQVVNSTATNNEAGRGGGLYNQLTDGTSRVSFSNSILWGNTASQSGAEIYNDGSPETALTHTLIEGGVNGTGVAGDVDNIDDGANRNRNPRLVEPSDPAGPDGRFGTGDDGTIPIAGAPTLDAGINDSVRVGTDVAGQPRTQDQTGNGTETVDLGAYEGTTALPPTAATGEAQSVTGTTADLTGQVDPNGAPTTAQVAVAPTADVGDVRTFAYPSNPVEGAADQSLAIAIDGLSPETEYEARLVGANTEGNDRGQIITFTTGATGPPNATVKSPPTVGASSADLSGTVNPGGTETTAAFEYRKAGTSSFTSVQAAESPLTGTSDQMVSASVTGLEPGTDYEVELAAENSEGTDEDGPAVFTTEPVEVAVTGGGFGGLDRTFSATQGQAAQPVGILRLTPQQAGARLADVSVTPNADGAMGVERASLWLSTDDTFDASSDTELASVDTDPAGTPGEISFGALGADLADRPHYLFVAVTLTPDASGTITGFLASEAALSLTGGRIATVNGNEQTGFSNLPLSVEATPLPVEIARFEGRTTEDGARLVWTTASEEDNAGFRVQRSIRRSAGETSWTRVGFVEGSGTTSETQTYRFMDTDVPYAADTLRYRLRQVDTDGTASLTDPVTVVRGGPDGLRLLGTAPNPVRQRTTVRFGIPESVARSGEEVRLRLYDVMGRQVRSEVVSGEAGRHEQSLRVGGLASGVYLLRLETASATRTRKITVVR